MIADGQPIRRRDYWASLFDGQRHTLVRGRDYNVDERKVYDRARSAARRRKIEVVVTYSREMGRVVVKAQA